MQRRQTSEHAKARGPATGRRPRGLTRADGDIFNAGWPLGYVIFDERGVVSEINRAAAELLGVRRETLLGLPFPAALPPGEVVSFLEHLRRCRDGEATQIRTPLNVGKTHRVPAELSTVPTMQHGQRRFVTAIIDLSHREEGVRHLQEAKALAEHLFEFVPQPLAVLNEKLVIQATNSAFREKFRSRLSELQGLPLPDLESIRWGSEAFLKLLRRVASHQVPFKDFSVGCSLSVTGQQLTLLANALRLVPRHGTGEPVILLTFEDITQRRRHEQERERMLEELRDLNATLERRVRTRTGELARLNEQLQALSQRVIEAQETERRHLARELHDEVGQVLTGLNMLLHRAGEDAAPGVRREIHEARRVVADLLERVRRMSIDLRPAMLDDLGLCVAVRAHVDAFSKHTGIRMDFDCAQVDEEGIPPEIKVTAFRCVQETLTNMARHAGTRRASVALRANASSLFLEVADAGKGFDTRQPRQNGSGLNGLRERVALASGQLDLESAPGRGTRVLVQLPLRAAKGQENK